MGLSRLCPSLTAFFKMALSSADRSLPPSASFDVHHTNGYANGYQSTSSSSHSPSLTVKVTSSSSSPPPIPSPPLSTSPLSNRIRLSYAVGHVLNDLVASCWFSYLLVFLRTVLLFPSTQAGLLLLIGQISDGLATPVVGFLSDKTDIRFGKRRAWIAIGSFIVALSFPPIFHQPFLSFLSLSSSLTLLVLYYAFFIVIFQWAWASVQVSHLALVPELSRDSNERVYLNSLRSIATILSNVTVFCLAFVILHTCSSVQPIGPDDVGAFWKLAVVVVAVGAVFSVLFVCGVPEPQPRRKRSGQKVREWYHWFAELDFYQIMIVYTCTRLMVNVSQTYATHHTHYQHVAAQPHVRNSHRGLCLMCHMHASYMPLYLLVTLGAPKSSIASVPLVCFASGLISTCVCERLTRRWGSAGLTMVGCLTVLLSCWGVWVVGSGNWLWAYAVAFVLGSGTGIVGVSALSLICELVGDCCESGAFVYGAMSFSDKIANGVAIMATEALTPSAVGCAEAGKGECMRVTERQQAYYRWVMLLAPGGSTIVAMLMLSFMIVSRRVRSQHVTPVSSSATSSFASVSASPQLATSASPSSAPSSRGPCPPYDWNNTTASALQGVRGVSVHSPMQPSAPVHLPLSAVDGENMAVSEHTPLLSQSYHG